MKKIKLMSLRIKNFKGIASLRIDPGGDDLYIYGPNGAGKSTIADALSWLLQDEDSRGQSSQSFDILPDSKKLIEYQQGLQAEVEAEFAIMNEEAENEKVILKRTFAQDWDNEGKDWYRDGNDYGYYVNGSSVRKKEYMGTIEKYMGERIELLTNPYEFSERLHWRDRRKILLDMIDIPRPWEEEGFEELAQYITEPDQLLELKKQFESRMRELNDEVERLRSKLEEHSLPEEYEAAIDYEATLENIQDKIEAKEDKLAELQEEKGARKAGRGASRKAEEIQRINSKMLEVKNEHEQEVQEVIDDKRHEKRQLEHRIEQQDDKIQTAKQKLIQLKQDWKDWKQAEQTTCPECGQELPEEQQEQFLNKKAEKLKEIEAEGERWNNKLKEAKKDKEEALDELAKIEEEIEEAQERYDDLPAEYDDLAAKKEELKEEMEQIEAGGKVDTSDIDEKIAETKAELKDLRAEENRIRQLIDVADRIDQLRSKLDEAQEEYEEKAYLAELAKKAAEKQDDLLQERANELFDMAEISMFKETQDGRRKPDCTIKSKGTDYNTNLNYGHRILVGLDVIKTLSEHYGLALPIIMDNAESITENVDVPGQLICMIAAPQEHVEKAEEGRRDKAVTKHDNKDLLIITN